MEKTILLVEDDEDLRESLASFLRLSGFSLATAKSGMDALAYLKRANAPALVLLDLMMPGMSGWELRNQMLSEPTLSTIPVAVMTGVADAEQEAAGIGADAYFTKPFDLDAMVDVLHRYT